MRQDPTCRATVPGLRILVGTPTAVRLAEAVAVRFGDRLSVEVALYGGAGRAPRGCVVDRIGPGMPSLAGTRAVLDGLDPFEVGLVRDARAAARREGVPCLAFRPPVWQRHPLDRWIEVYDLQGAVGAAAAIARTVLLAVPESDLAAFEPLSGLNFPVRLARPPSHWNRPPGFVPQLCPPPRHRTAEIQLLRRTGADAVVIRGTGCGADAPLLAAARSLDLPVVMIRRPPDQGEVARSVETVLDWLTAIVAGVRSETAAVPAWR